jgi:hypothetical protein
VPEAGAVRAGIQVREDSLGADLGGAAAEEMDIGLGFDAGQDLCGEWRGTQDDHVPDFFAQVAQAVIQGGCECSTSQVRNLSGGIARPLDVGVEDEDLGTRIRCMALLPGWVRPGVKREVPGVVRTGHVQLFRQSTRVI